MRRRLIWAILTLPLIASIFIWIATYWYQAELLSESGRFADVGVGVNRGSLMFGVSGRDQWKFKGSQWKFEFGVSDETWGEPAHHFLGFGYESDSFLLHNATVLQAPMWFIALLTAIPPLLLYRRYRKRRNPGFPIEPSPPNDSLTH